MLDTDEIKMINEGWLTLNIVWIAMLISLVIYLQLGFYLEYHIYFSISKSFPINTLRKALYVTSIITVILAKYIRKYMLDKKEVRSINKKPQPSTMFNQHPAVIKYSTAILYSLAMSESAGLFGLILFVLGNILTDLYIMLAISAAALLYYRPRKKELLNLANFLKEQETGA